MIAKPALPVEKRKVARTRKVALVARQDPVHEWKEADRALVEGSIQMIGGRAPCAPCVGRVVATNSSLHEQKLAAVRNVVRAVGVGAD